MPIEYSVSDHYPVYAVIDLKNNLTWCANDTHKTIHYRKYAHFKADDYLKDLQNADWLYSNKTMCTTNEYPNNFVNVFSNIVNKHLPMVKKTNIKTKSARLDDTRYTNCVKNARKRKEK